MSDLAAITTKLGSAHATSKKAEKELKESRSEFFVAIDDEIVENETLARQTIELPSDIPFPVNEDDQGVINYVKQFHPGWRLADVGSKENTYIIEEDPSFKKFVYVNRKDGQVYRRNVSQAGPSLDDERLKEENPELWKRITESKVIPRQVTRVLKDLETVSNKDLAEMQEYFVPGPMTVKLDAPRKAKPDELDA
jgi:hypothetical protein